MVATSQTDEDTSVHYPKNPKNVTSTVGGAADCRRALSENRTEGTVGDGNVVTASFTALTNDDTSPKL